MSATMIPLSNEKLLTDSEFRRLREGSYEDIASRIQAAVVATSSDHFVEGSSIEVVSTYPDRAVVAADGNFFEAKVETNNSGEYRIVDVEPLNVESYDQDNLSQYLHKEASAAVDLFLKGSTQAAVDHMKTMVPYVDAKSKPDFSLESVSVQLDKESSWKRTLAERSSEIEAVVTGTLDVGTHLWEGEAKFRSLHECTDCEKLESYSGLVSEDLGSVVSHIESRLEDVTGARQVVLDVLKSDDACLEDGTSVLKTFASFSKSLESDICKLFETVERCRVGVEGDVSTLSKLHDLLTERLRPYDMGTLFVVAVAQRLNGSK